MGKKELFFIFMLFIIGGTVIFAFGVKVGEYLFENECQSIVDRGLQEAAERQEAYQEQKPEPVVEEIEEIEVIEQDPDEKQIKDAQQIIDDERIGKKRSDKGISAYTLGIREITSEIKGKYTIQISSYQDETSAQDEAYRLYLAGFKLAYYMEADIPGKGTWNRVGIGFFTKLSNAKIFAEMLKKQNKIQTYIIRKID
jgi:cell division septation protein DedD